MEERGPPSTSSNASDDYPLNSTHKYHNVPLDAPSGTYVVQVPKDLIYRTPPPENALIIERHRNATTKKQSNCAKYVLISIAIIVLLLGLICAIMLIVIKKDDPKFRIERVHVTTKGKTGQKKTEFDITLTSRNPNSNTVIIFNDHGKAALSFKEKRFAMGKFPSTEQSPKNSKDVKLTLTSKSNTKLPMEIRKSMNATAGKSQRHVEIFLEFRVPVKMKFGTLRMKSKTISMLCHFKVNNLAKSPRILSQDCDYSTRY
ncbi:hypothetical protein L2E82_21411 [Cichorium intybus]|uniref:Uncharacterized protein n=1 Tax=Cichorium intybus TaxID=13427 RepID=A0ACB9DVT2_CICIN|nr:hypothetical protein L2E82_21411 [Cichorium intybus]